MEDSRAANQKVIVTLTDAELSALVSLAGVNTGNGSPLSGVTGVSHSADSRAVARLRQIGLLAPAPPDRPTQPCLAALNILAKPDIELRLVWGDVDNTGFTTLFAAGADGAEGMVGFTRDGDSQYKLSYFVSHEEITALVRDRIAFTELKEYPPLLYETGPTVLPVLLAVLDLYQEARLKAALDRTQALNADISAEAVKRILVEAKTSASLDWYAPLGFIMLPATIPDDAAIKAALQALQQRGALTSDKGKSTLSSALASFALRAFPVVSYFGATVRTRAGSAFGGAQFALIRSRTTLLFIQRAADASGERFAVSSISTSHLPEVLFNLATLPFEGSAPQKAPEAAASEGTACGKCGAKNAAAAKFCEKCGASLAAPAIKFCPKCGDAVNAGEKFCDKCGTKLV